MATKLYLTTQAGFTYQNYNMLTGTLALVEGSRKVTISGDRAIETMELISARSTTDSAIIIAENKLNELGTWAREYASDHLIKYPVWLQENATSETLRQALVYDIRCVQKEERHTSRLLGREGVTVWTLYIERSNWWEPVTVISQTVASGVASCGGNDCIEVLASNAGVIDGRIPALIVVPTDGTMYELWCGIRKPREETDISILGVRSVWPLVSGTNGTDTATASEATNAYAGTTNNIKQCTFATVATMAKRLSINWNSAFGYYYPSLVQFYPGKYLVLARVKVGSSTECRLRMYSGYGSAQRVYNDVDISNTAYKLIPIGEVTIPGPGYRAASSVYALDSTVLSTHDIHLYAERLSGTGYLYLDTLIFIPTDAFFYAKVSSLTAASGYRVVLYTFPDGEQQAIVGDSYLQMIDGGEFRIENWRMPYMGPNEEGMQNLIVFAFQSATVQTATEDLGYQIVYLPRYLGFSRYA